jgi:hypothetical protein
VENIWTYERREARGEVSSSINDPLDDKSKGDERDEKHSIHEDRSIRNLHKIAT